MVVLLVGVAPVQAGAAEIPPGGVPLVAVDDVATEWDFYSGSHNGGPVALRSAVDGITGQPFTRAARFDVQNPDGLFYSSAASAASSRAVEAGDVVLIHFFLRAIASQDETGSVFVQVYAEDSDFTKSVSVQASAGPEWMEYFIPFAVAENYAAEEFGVKFGFGASVRPQVLELGGVEVLWYGKNVPLDQMPRTSFRYDGREPDAPWREAAAERIEQYRKANYEVRVVNPDGLPVAGADVRVRMRRHAFEFGTAFVASRVVDQTDDENRVYLQRLLELFNAGSPENDLKWPAWEGDWGEGFNHDQTIDALAGLQAAGMRLRGHVLVWPGKDNLPESIVDLLKADPPDPSIPQRVLDHIASIVPSTRDYLTEWDVINEPYDNHDLMDQFGNELMVDWFVAAWTHHPTARLYINDYGILSGGGLNTTKQQFYEDTIRYLLEQGAPIGGIGFQGHFDSSPTGIARVLSVLDRYAAAFPNLPFRITEFDVDTEDEQLQADYTRDFLTAVFSHPHVIGFQVWGFWEGQIWRQRAAMYRQDWTEKPNGAAYRDLVFNQWWTDETRTTGIDGRVRGRGFLGDYDVTVTVNGVEYPATLVLPPAGGSVNVVVDVPVDGAPQIIAQPFGMTVSPGEDVFLTLEVTGHPAPTITWFKNGSPLAQGSTIVMTGADAADEGVYYAKVDNGLDSVESRRVRVGVRPPEARTEKLINISTRGRVARDADVMIAGFFLDGNKDILIRGIGPRLADLGVTNPLRDPVLRIFRAGENAPFDENDDWDQNLTPVMDAVFAFPLIAPPPGTQDTKSSALHLPLAAGGYTVHLLDKNDEPGVGMVEIYDVATGAPIDLINISTRGVVGTGDEVMIAGFVIQGSVPKRVLIRGVGPSLSKLGVDEQKVLGDPVLTLFEQISGGGAREIATNDDWAVGNNANAIRDAAAAVYAFPLKEFSRDACLLLFLEPGIYTAQLAGAGGTTGIGLVEVYAVE